MKSRYKLILLILMVFTVGALVSCSDDEDVASISYVRVTDPTVSDSLLVSAGQGALIAIMGQNLGSVREIWFNNLQAQLNPSFITNNTVLVHVPSLVPDVITNKIKMVFANGQSLLYDFTVSINKPLLDHSKCDYLNKGDTLFIYGDYFYAPLTIKFANNDPAEIMSVSKDSKTLMVKVPDVVPPGPISVTSNFGTTKSRFWLQDNRNIVATFEGPSFEGFWRGSDFVVASDPSVPNINGKFMRVNKGKLGGYPYLELYGGPAGGGPAALTRVIPQAAFTNPADYSLKMEVNTLQPMSGIVMRIYFGGATSNFGDARNAIYYQWKPNIDSKGRWTTVTIPWKDVYGANQLFSYNSDGYGMYMYCHGPDAAFYNFAIDNIRVVPN